MSSAMSYIVVVEPAGNNFSAYVPDLPGCVATGATQEETINTIAEAIGFHIEGLRGEGMPVPTPRAVAVTVDA